MSDRPVDENFDLLIVGEPDNYLARCSSSAGESSQNFSAPFTVEEFNDFMRLLSEAPISGSRITEAIKEFGGHLLATVFKGQIHSLLSISRDRAERLGVKLRIRLNLTAVPELADLPWEYLYDRDRNVFYALSENTPIVRYLDMTGTIQPLTVRLPLRVLVMISNPSDYPRLDVEQELKRLKESLESLLSAGLVKLRQVKATYNELQEQLQKETFHIFHFIGHGGLDPRVGGYLIMEDVEGKGFTLNGEGLGEMLHDHNFRLVILNACEGARTSLTDPFAGTAQRIIQAEVPAVIAMQFNISDDSAIIFAKSFYEALATYRPIDVALASARKAIKGNGNNIEWATPALYMRSDDGHIFEKGLMEKDVDPNELYYRSIIKRMREGKVILILGPSINRCGRGQDEGYKHGGYPPDYTEIARYLANSLSDKNALQYLSDKTTLQDLARVSQYVATLVSPETLSSELQSLLDDDYEPTPLHHLLASLPGLLRNKGDAPPYQLIVTSNYDDVLEKAFQARGEEYDMIHYEAEDGKMRGEFYHTPFGMPRRRITRNMHDDLTLDRRTMILKIHGAVNRANSEPQSCLIMEDHYIDYLANNESLLKKIRGLLTESHFLFLGYRLRDWNSRVIFHRLWGDKKIRHDSWVVQPDPDPIDRRFWDKLNVHPLDVSLIDFVKEIRARLE